ncbi:hypothetical protein [Amycolatopsis sp. La24]|uniref:hypothetical protein n=1 Tax=Amycolatopsis sp. La24 TaxID=3028304 RepID=UPI0023AF67E8|nr:hypothetical protein [Amycolatopsis sp. La24]
MAALLEPWYIVGGYVLTLLLLMLASRFENRSVVKTAVCEALSIAALFGTTLYWLTAGTESSGPAIGWVCIPIAMAGFAAWRVLRQRFWIRRLGAVEEPTFGVLPRQGRTVAITEPDRPRTRRTAEFDHQGHQLLGVEYSSGAPDGVLDSVANQVDGIYTLVEMRVPAGPTLVISPRTKAFEPEHFTPLEDAKITRNQAGSPKPGEELAAFELDPDFDRRFSVTTSDPEFARQVLTGEVREMIMTDLWFRVHEVVFDRDSMWTAEAGGLTEERMLGNGRRLAMLAAVLSPSLWNSAEAAEFRRVTARAETSYDAWYGKRAGLIRTKLNRRREALDRQPVTSTSLAMRSLIAAVMIVSAVLAMSNSVLVMNGQGTEVDLKVTWIDRGAAPVCRGSSGKCTGGSAARVRGTYVLDGSTHTSTTRWSEEMPEVGDVVKVQLGPLWWSPIFESGRAAQGVIFTCLFPLLFGLLIVKVTYWPRASRRVRKTREALATA